MNWNLLDMKLQSECYVNFIIRIPDIDHLYSIIKFLSNSCLVCLSTTSQWRKKSQSFTSISQVFFPHDTAQNYNYNFLHNFFFLLSSLLVKNQLLCSFALSFIFYFSKRAFRKNDYNFSLSLDVVSHFLAASFLTFFLMRISFTSLMLDFLTV